MRYIIAAFLLVGFLAPLPKDRQDGAYNLISRMAWCRTQAACLHEIGHALDQQSDWTSASPEFYKALQMYLYAEIYSKGITELPASILEITYRGEGGNAKREIYAFIFQYAKGNPDNVPESLRGFYDWQKANELLLKLNDSKVYWMN
jgi:hypothetical protein